MEGITDINSSTDRLQHEETLIPYNTQDDEDQQMMIYSSFDQNNDQEFIPSNNTLINQNNINNNDINNSICSLGMIFSPLLPTITSQAPNNLDNIDWVNLFSSPPCDDQQTTVEPSSISVGSSSTSNHLNKDANIDGEIKEISNKETRVSSSMKKKRVPPKFAFHTRSDEDVLDDGYKWRKYGQKSVKNSVHPRSYYRCTYHTCNVKKQIQRHSRDTNIVITTYEGIHNHPSEKLMETLSPLLRQLQFLSRF